MVDDHPSRRHGEGMRKYLPLIFAEFIWFGVAGMVDAWLPCSPGWFWAAVTAVGVFGLAFWSLRDKLPVRKPKHFTAAASPASFHFRTSQPTVTVKPAGKLRRVWNWVWRKIAMLRQEDKRAVKQNPGDGMAIARMIMNSPTLAKVEALYADFHSQPYKGTEEGQVHVAAARRIRQARAEGVQDIPWEFSRAAEEAASPFGRDAYRRAVFNLVNQFPEAGDIKGKTQGCGQ